MCEIIFELLLADEEEEVPVEEDVEKFPMLEDIVEV
ncbi:hypothetical protein EVAR_70781_1, partial [Eumeta japonica]